MNAGRAAALRGRQRTKPRAQTATAVVVTLLLSLIASTSAERDTGWLCYRVIGDWCANYYAQELLPVLPPPTARPSSSSAANRACEASMGAAAAACSGRGVCNADTGRCDCPAGARKETAGSVVLARVGSCRQSGNCRNARKQKRGGVRPSAASDLPRHRESSPESENPR